MPILEEKIESPAERLSRTLREINFKNEQEKLATIKKIQNEEKQRKLFDILQSQNSNIKDTQEVIRKEQEALKSLKESISSKQEIEDRKFKEIVQHIINLNNKSIDKIKEVESSLKKEIESYNKNFEMVVPGYFIDIKALKDFINSARVYYKDLLDKPQLLTIEDIDKRIDNFEENYRHILSKPNILDKEETILLIQEFLKRLKINYQDLNNKPNILDEKNVNRLIFDYSKKIENLFQIDLKTSTIKIEKLKKDYVIIKKLADNLEKSIKEIKEEHKKITLKKDYSYSSYSADGGYDYATVRMTKITFITSDYPASSVDFGIMANATSGAITVTLPPALKTGQVLAIKKIDSSTNAITITRSGSDTIEGIASITLNAQYENRWLISGGNSIWYVIASEMKPESLTGTQDGSNVTFTVLNMPKFITRNGQILYEGAGYSRSGLTLTLDEAPYSTDVLRSHSLI